MKILDYVMKGIFYTGLISAIIALLYISGKLIVQDSVLPGWLKIVVLLFSISGAYLFFKNRFDS